MKCIVDSPVMIFAIVIACSFQAVMLICSVTKEPRLLLKKRTVTIVFSLYFYCPLVYSSALYPVFSSSNSNRYCIEVIHSSIYIRSTDPVWTQRPFAIPADGKQTRQYSWNHKGEKEKKKKRQRGTREILVPSFHPICYLFTCVSCPFDHLAQ